MKVTTITFMQTFPTGNYSNQKLGVEIELEEKDRDGSDATAEIVAKGIFEYAKKVVNDAFKEMNPGIELTTDYSAIPGHPMNVTQVDSREEKIKAMFITISECKTVRNLSMFEAEVIRLNDKSLFEAYNNKKKELQ